MLRYSSDQQNLARFFSDPKGEYRKAAGPNGENASRVFILAEHSVSSSWHMLLNTTEHRLVDPAQAIAREAARCFKSPKKLGGLAAQRAAARGDPAALKVKDGVRLEGTIFGMHFNLVAYDESHTLRNVSLMSLAATWISARALVRVGTTATPIFTGPKVSPS